MPVTVLIWAICEVICALSSGFIGSWLFNWATSSFKNRSCELAASLALMFFVLVLALSTPVLDELEVMAEVMQVCFQKFGKGVRALIGPFAAS